MKTIKQIILVLLFLPNIMVSAQQFWLTTNEFWGGPKTGITKVNDSMMFVSTTNSVMRSTNQFQKLDKVLDASAIYSLFSTKQGTIFAGGSGKVFISDDLGMSWDSTLINTIYPIKQIIENSYGELTAITGIYDDGDGVFFSRDEGKSWETRNNGLNSYLGCDKIAIDKNDRLYLTMCDPDKFGYGGLYISENSGLSWQKIVVNIDSIGNNIKIGITTNLSVLSNDSIYLSFYGSGGNFAVELNIYKSINDITTANNWSRLHVKNYNTWGMDELLNNIYLSQNGDWYSSVDGHIYTSGTCFSKEGKSWEILEYGLGLNEFERHSEQYFVETEQGKIFMIQMLDERIYVTDKSIPTNVPLPVELESQIKVHPNPIRKAEYFILEMDEYSDSNEISVYEISGKKLFNTRAYGPKTNIQAPVKEGIYIVSVRNGYSVNAQKIVVN